MPAEWAAQRCGSAPVPPADRTPPTELGKPRPAAAGRVSANVERVSAVGLQQVPRSVGARGRWSSRRSLGQVLR